MAGNRHEHHHGVKHGSGHTHGTKGKIEAEVRKRGHADVRDLRDIFRLPDTHALDDAPSPEDETAPAAEAPLSVEERKP